MGSRGYRIKRLPTVPPGEKRGVLFTNVRIADTFISVGASSGGCIFNRRQRIDPHRHRSSGPAPFIH